ncbi:MAG TPA: lysophospholipid acyltransferase family protein [Gemmatimonadaceae bacterium]|nr:lysophospholipid acyltransferase family protein [Gemmatimonadaceae bacterium]
MTDETLPVSAHAAITLGGIALQALGRTWRYEVRGSEHLEALRLHGSPFIFSLWHGQLLPLIWHHRNQRVAILVSEHRDGEIIARVAQSIGYRLIRGSSTRGADRALLALVRQLKAGAEVAVTPDGPRGPARSYAPGALIAAQRSGAAILPITAHVDNAWHLSSWDRFIIPKPFAKVTVAYGAPVYVEARSSREATAAASRLQAAMGDTEKLACA